MNVPNTLCNSMFCHIENGRASDSNSLSLCGQNILSTMAFPKPVPTLNEDELAQFREELDEFELSEDVVSDIYKHLELLEAED